jgi:phosphohistidine phosphatase
MILTIWRHGTAEYGSNDRLRELTTEGREDLGFGSGRFRQACLLRNIAPVTTLLHSPWVRTTQTAEIIAIALHAPTVVSEDALRPGSTLAGVDTLVSSYTQSDTQQHIVLVSHQPMVSNLVDRYLGDAGVVPPLPPGGLVSLSLEVVAPGCARLLFWAFPPEYEVGM